MKQPQKALTLLFVAMLGTVCAAAEIPHLRQHGEATQLIVDGRPFLILGGEFGNSTTSSLENQGAGRMTGFAPAIAYDGTVAREPETVTPGDYRFEVSYIVIYYRHE